MTNVMDEYTTPVLPGIDWPELAPAVETAAPREPSMTDEVAQSFYLLALLAGTLGAFVGLAMLIVRVVG